MSQPIERTPYGEGQIKSDVFSKPVKVGNSAEVTRTIVVTLKQRDLLDARTDATVAKASITAYDKTRLIAERDAILTELNKVIT